MGIFKYQETNTSFAVIALAGQLIDSSARCCLGLQCPTVTAHLANVCGGAHTWRNINKVTAGRGHLGRCQLWGGALGSAEGMQVMLEATCRNISRTKKGIADTRSDPPKNFWSCVCTICAPSCTRAAQTRVCRRVFIFYKPPKILFSGLIRAKQGGGTPARHSCMFQRQSEGASCM